MDRWNLWKINAATAALWGACLAHGTLLWHGFWPFLGGQALVLAGTVLLAWWSRPLLAVQQRMTGVHAHLPFAAMLVLAALSPAVMITGRALGLDEPWLARGQVALVAAYMFAGFWMALTMLRLVWLGAARSGRLLPKGLTALTGLALFAGPGAVYARFFAAADLAQPIVALGAFPYVATIFFGVCFLYAQASLKHL